MIKLLRNLSKKYFKTFSLGVYRFLNKTSLRKFLPLKSLYIEVTSRCNLNCKGCYRNTHNYGSKNKNMPLDNFKKYVNQVHYVNSLYLHGLGEPSLNPQISEIIEYASKSGKFNNIAFTTNALAKDPKIFEVLFSKGLSQITISVDSLLENEVNLIRPFTNTNKLIKNIKWLLQRFPEKIKISMVINNINFNTFEKTLKKLESIGVKEISCHPYEDFGYPELNLSIKKRNEFLQKIKNLKLKNIIIHPSGFTFTKDYCNLPFTAPVINVRGYLTPCCRINDEKIVNAGNLNERNFKDIFYSKKYNKMQQNIRRGIYPFFCKDCMGNHIEVRNLLKKENKLY